MKKIVSTLLVSLLVLLNCVVSNATNAANLTFTSNSTSVNVGSEITVYLDLNSVSGVDTITAISGKLSYDANTFELVSVTGENSWNILSGNILSITRAQGATSGRILKVVLKAIKKPDNGVSVLKLTQVETTDNNDAFEQDDVSFSINVKEVSQEETPTTPEENKVENTTIPPAINNNTSTSQNKVADNTTISKKLPATGLDITIAVSIILAMIIGIASFIRYKQVKIK